MRSKSLLALSPEEIHLWFVFPEQVVDPVLLNSYVQLLTPEERAQQSRFHFAADRHRYLLTRALARVALSRYAPVAATDWRFIPDGYGRPHVASNLARVTDGLSFNISHTRELILLGITQESALGVDVEGLQSRSASVEIANRFFSNSEVSALMALPTAKRHERFFSYWTLKESYVKARGVGLSISLDQFGFDLDGSECSIGFWTQSQLDGDAESWRFWQAIVAKEYLVAVCARRNGDYAQRLVSRICVPGDFEDTLELALIRRSHS